MKKGKVKKRGTKKDVFNHIPNFHKIKKLGSKLNTSSHFTVSGTAGDPDPDGDSFRLNTGDDSYESPSQRSLSNYQPVFRKTAKPVPLIVERDRIDKLHDEDGVREDELLVERKLHARRVIAEANSIRGRKKAKLFNGLMKKVKTVSQI